MKARARSLLRLGAAGFAAAAVAVGPGAAQDPGGEGAEPAQRLYSAGEFVGPATCASGNCHGRSAPGGDYEVLQNEFTTWIYDDPHHGAHESLLDERSALIARNLNLEGEPSAAPLCLTCHALTVPRGRRAGQVKAADGVSCESCHGAAGGWLERHTEAAWTYRDSVAQGLTDLRDVRVRARVCLRCHLGDPERQVDHELLAAGHPELVFELDNYSEAMPPHWRRRTDGVRSWAAGQVEAFRHGLLQLARRTRTEKWPEFAEMSCDTCHHPLAEGRWRQLRGFELRAGMPSWSPARWLVLRRVVEAFAPEEAAALDPEVEKIARDVSLLSAPPERVRDAAERAAAILDRVLPKVARAAWSEERERQLVAAFLADRDRVLAADRQGAEQTAMAIQSLMASLIDRRPQSVSQEARSTLDRLFAELEDPYRYDRERFAQELATLSTQLR